MDDFKVGMVTLGAVGAIVTICITIGCLVANEQNVRAEKQCLDSGKSITWKAVEGEVNAKKECK